MLMPASDARAATLAFYAAAPGTPAAALTCSQTRSVHGEAVLHLEGELDVATAPQLQSALRAAQEATRHVVVDLRDLTFIGIAGVRALAAAGDRARRAGKRLVVVTGTPASRVFELTGSWDDIEFRDAGGGRADAPADAAVARPSVRHRLPGPSRSGGR